MATLNVGAGEMFATLSDAIAASRDGDVIKVAAGTYTNDFATITTKITIEGVGGMVHLLATVPPPDGKAILTIDTDATLYNIEFSGAAVADGNGAGIRYEGGNLALFNTYFHDNQDGLLADSDPAGSITITDSEFANNGTGDGFTHNLYVGEVGTLTITGSYFHDVNVGHEIKSRALNTIIENNRIGDGPNGDGSYDIDLPNGGDATIQNNVIEKGPNALNHNFISFGEEGGVYSGSTLSVTGNTVLNDDGGSATLVHDMTGTTVQIANNQFYGITPSEYYSGTGTPAVSGNTTLTTEPAFDTSDPYLPVRPFQFACFAGGTRILTQAGEVDVELLQPGAQVVTLVDGSHVVRTVKWVGHRRVVVAAHPRPEMVMPVRIRRGAIADGVPHRDLLISPDHALYLDGALIIARQLINRGTICQPRSMRGVRYYHVELETHGILLAEGLPVESYLDTGNRGFFTNSGEPLILHPYLTGSEAREAGSCAPLRTDEGSVWPIWRRLADRSEALGYPDATPSASNDPDLLLSVGGRLTPAASVDGRCHAFVVPPGVRQVRLLSRSAAPTDCRPWLHDQRKLGVSIGRIVLRADDGVTEIPLDHPGLSTGWWAVEHDAASPVRWTNGSASLPLSRLHAPAVLEVHLAGEMLYPSQVRPSQIRGEAARRRA